MKEIFKEMKAKINYLETELEEIRYLKNQYTLKEANPATENQEDKQNMLESVKKPVDESVKEVSTWFKWENCDYKCKNEGTLSRQKKKKCGTFL